MDQLVSNPLVFLVTFLALILSIGVHEFSHVLSAYLQGDHTGKDLGRLTLNPIVHLDPLGTMFMLISLLAGVGIGWGKPAPFNPYNLRSRRWGSALVGIAGPISNIVLVALAGYALLFFGTNLESTNLLRIFLQSLVLVNAALAVFNFIPVHPLDGSHILRAIFPTSPAVDALERYGPFVLLALVFFGRGLLGAIIFGGIKIILTVLGLG